MSEQVIEMIVSPKGEVRIDPKGFKGGACKAATASLEAMFGEVISTSPTAEAYEGPIEATIKAQQK